MDAPHCLTALTTLLSAAPLAMPLSRPWLLSQIAWGLVGDFGWKTKNLSGLGKAENLPMVVIG